jgi:hypothetical protein
MSLGGSGGRSFPDEEYTTVGLANAEYWGERACSGLAAVGLLVVRDGCWWF